MKRLALACLGLVGVALAISWPLQPGFQYRASVSFFDKARSLLSGKINRPVPELPSIHAHISAHLPEDGPGLPAGGDKLPDDAREKVKDSVAKVEEALEGDDTAAIKSATDELHKTFAELAAAAEIPADGAAEPGAQPASEDGEEEPKQAKGTVVDADFEVVDEEKK